MNALDVLGRAAARYSERPFLYDVTTSVTFGEADRRARAVAAGLQAAGVQPNDPVGLSGIDSVDLIVHLLGCWYAGAIPSMVDPRTPEDKLPYFADDIAPKLVIADEGQIDRLGSVFAAPIHPLGSIATDASALTLAHGDHSGLIWSYTSGSTGDPKACVIESAPVALGTACIAERLSIGPSDVLLATTPAASSFQLVACLLPALHRGSSVVLVAGQSVDAIWAAAQDRSASVLVAYPLTLGDMVHHPAASHDHSFQCALSGGSPLAPRLKRDYASRLGIPLLESYGQSEIGGFMAMGRRDEDASDGFVGRSLPDRLAYVGAEDGSELPAGEVGEILVREGFFPGYRNKPEATAKTLAGGRLHCGDLGVADDAGRIRVLGRTNEAELSRDRGLFLRDVEDALYEHPSVKHAAVVDGEGEAIEAFVEPLDEVAPGDLREDVSSRLSLRPDLAVHLLDVMPRTFSGKADRLGLSMRHA